MSETCDCDYLMETSEHWEPHYDNCRTMLLKRKEAEDYKKKYPKNADGSIVLQNEHLSRLHTDVLYHLAIAVDSQDLPALFGDVKFVCMGGTDERMEVFAKYMADVLGLPEPTVNLTRASHRCAMYKVGPVLSVSHGMGIPSMTIILQEIIKLLHYARARNPLVFRIGTSGGLGLVPGSVVVSTFGMSGMLTKTYDLPILGKMTSRPALFDRRLAQELVSVARAGDPFRIVTGGTMAADDFYLGQARMDGPFCHHSNEDKLKFLRELRERGVRNIEMESTAFAAVTRDAALRAADVCVTLLDRLLGDQVTSSKETLAEWQRRPMTIVGRYIERVMQSNDICKTIETKNISEKRPSSSDRLALNNCEI